MDDTALQSYSICFALSLFFFFIIWNAITYVFDSEMIKLKRYQDKDEMGKKEFI